jgi:hypothetical protein
MKAIIKKLFLALTILLSYNTILAQNELPPVNQKIVDFSTKSMGKKVDRGECWDLAKFALDYAGAKWEAPFDYGKIVDPKKDTILAGDIIQFEKVKSSNGISFPHHTAIVYKVISSGKYLIAHQNFNYIRKVGTLELDLSLVTKGSIKFYRPH